VDELLCRLRKSGYGCKIGHLYYGAVGYADDVSFIAPSVYALNMMCQIALEYASEYDITFNPSKCQFINYSAHDNINFSFDGLKLKSMNKGHITGPNIEESLLLDASYTLTRNVD